MNNTPLAATRRPRAGRPRSATADAAILEAALSLFAERGFDSVTFEDVASQAGVARTTVYRRWSSKAELVAEAVATERGEPEALYAAGRVSARASRRRLVSAVASALTAPRLRNVMARLIGSRPDHPELMSTYWRNYLAPRRVAVARLLERAREEGLVRADADLEILLDLISGALTHELLIRPGERTAPELEAYLERVLGELEAPKA